MPLHYGTASGSDRMLASTALGQIGINRNRAVLSLSPGRYRSRFRSGVTLSRGPDLTGNPFSALTSEVQRWYMNDEDDPRVTNVRRVFWNIEPPGQRQLKVTSLNLMRLPTKT